MEHTTSANHEGYTLTLVQKITMMRNQWVIARTAPDQVELGVITQKRLSLKESVTCTAPDGDVSFRIQARNIIELAGTYDITDGQGARIGTIAKDFMSSLGRSTYTIETPLGRWTLTETSQLQAILRRAVRMFSDLPWLLRVQFSLLDEHGTKIGHVNRSNMRLKDTYEVRVDDPRLDQRVAAAVGVAADAFMNR